MSKMNQRLHSHFMRAYIMFMYSTSSKDLSLDWFLGRGKPLNPYLKGFLFRKILSFLKPKDIKVAPDWCYDSYSMLFGAERLLVSSWLSQWLAYLKWYTEACQDNSGRLEILFEAPIVSSSWKVVREEPAWVRFGFLWKLYDFVYSMGFNWTGGILPVEPVQSCIGSWVFGPGDHSNLSQYHPDVHCYTVWRSLFLFAKWQSAPTTVRIGAVSPILTTIGTNRTPFIIGTR